MNYPLYDERDNKWICMGWDSQIYENERISSGMAVRIDYNQEAGRYLPTRLNSVIQARQKTDTSKVVTRGYNLYLKDYIFNENLEIIQSSNSKELQPPQ
ncbi:MAG: hypothetical protein GWN16_06160 [Calditrichae bacterium]|nr:hypothetical protein [Calditrichia bacterium]